MFNLYDDLMSVEDLMECLGVCRNKIYELLKTKQIKSFKLGKAHRIPRVCLKEFVLNQVKMNHKEFGDLI